MKIENLIKGLQILEPYCVKPYQRHQSKISADNNEINVEIDYVPSNEDQIQLLEIGWQPNYIDPRRGWCCIL